MTDFKTNSIASIFSLDYNNLHHAMCIIPGKQGTKDNAGGLDGRGPWVPSAFTERRQKTPCKCFNKLSTTSVHSSSNYYFCTTLFTLYLL